MLRSNNITKIKACILPSKEPPSRKDPRELANVGHSECPEESHSPSVPTPVSRIDNISRHLFCDTSSTQLYVGTIYSLSILSSSKLSKVFHDFCLQSTTRASHTLLSLVIGLLVALTLPTISQLAPATLTSLDRRNIINIISEADFPFTFNKQH